MKEFEKKERSSSIFFCMFERTRRNERGYSRHTEIRIPVTGRVRSLNEGAKFRLAPIEVGRHDKPGEIGIGQVRFKSRLGAQSRNTRWDEEAAVLRHPTHDRVGDICRNMCVPRARVANFHDQEHTELENMRKARSGVGRALG